MALSQFGHVIELCLVAAYLMSLDEFHLFSTYSYLFGNKLIKSKLSISQDFLI
jgi:hypothetical protein